MSSKPILLVLGHHDKTVRNRKDQFKAFSSQFDVRVNEDFSREVFARALKEKKFPTFVDEADLGMGISSLL
jgi:hypothetical protein